MSAKEDLQKKIQSWEDQMEKAKESLVAILIAEYPFRLGDVVVTRRGKFTISSIRRARGCDVKVCAWGKKTLKDGTLSNREFELYERLDRIEPETK